MAGTIETLRVYLVDEEPCDGCWRPNALYVVNAGIDGLYITDSNGTPVLLNLSDGGTF